MNDDVTMWKWLADHLWAPLSAAIGALWLMLNARINRVEQKAENAVDKDSFQQFVERDSEEHERLRQSTIKIFDKLDEIKTILMTRK